jgi:predicted  nucleic acid-binding Zn-ribbon protein
MEALAAIHGGMSTMQLSITSIQQEVRSINKRVKQNQLDLQAASSTIILTVVMMRRMHLW